MEGQVLDEDVYEMLLDAKKKRKRYREMIETHQSLSRDIARCSNLVQECRKRLLSEFREWYEAVGGNVDELDALNLDEEPVRDTKSATSISISPIITDPNADKFYDTRASIMGRRSLVAGGRGPRRVSTAPVTVLGSRRKGGLY
jgi:hypothetical protein